MDAPGCVDRGRQGKHELLGASICPSLGCGRRAAPGLGPLVLGPHNRRGRTAGLQPSPELLWQGKHVLLHGKEGLDGYQGKGTPAPPLLGTDVIKRDTRELK